MTSDARTRSRLSSALLAASVAGAVLCAATWGPTIALADPVSELQAIQQQVSDANARYTEATENVEQLEAQIAENEARIAEFEEELPALREQAATSMRTLYKMQQSSGGLIELLLSSESFYDLLSLIQYLDVIQSQSADSVEELVSSVEELQTARATLDAQLEDAEAERADAEAALAEASAARSRLQAQIEAQAAAEAAERQAAIEAAKQKQEEEGDSATFVTESGNEAQVETPAGGSDDSGSSSSDDSSGSSSTGAGSVDWSSDKQAFVSEWTARIDAYLAGSPLAGYGSVFAEAAWENGVDPRFSPAISQVESGKGRYCFLPHNAWGWGSVSWDSWESAIWGHVRGLAIGYGGQLTYAGACQYCPPNADFWYSTVLANMQMI